MSLADHDLTSRTKDLKPRSYFLRTSSSTNHQCLWVRLLCLLLLLLHPLQKPHSTYLWWLRYDDGHATWDPIIPISFRDPSSVVATPTIISDLHRRLTRGPLKDAESSLINLFSHSHSERYILPEWVSRSYLINPLQQFISQSLWTTYSIVYKCKSYTLNSIYYGRPTLGLMF